MIAPSTRCLLALPLALALTLARPCDGQTTAPEWFQVARAKAKKGDLKGAIADYTKSIELDPVHASTYNNRGVARKDTGDYDGALADYSKAIELDPKYGLPYNGRGNIKRERGDIEGALADYNKSIEVDPKQHFPYLGRGIIKKQRGDHAGAIADYTKAIEVNPQYALSYYDRAIARRETGDFEGAMADCNAAIKIDPKFYRSYNVRAALHYRNRAWKQSLADYRMCAKFRGVPIESIYIWIWFNRVQLGQQKEAYKELAEFMAEKSQIEPDAWKAKAVAFLLDELSEEDLLTAAADAEEKMSAQECEALYYAGMKKLLAGDTAGATERFKRCAAIENKTYLAHGYAESELKVIESLPK